MLMPSPSDSLPSYVWGRTHEALPLGPLPSESREQRQRFVDHLGESPLWAVLGLADLLLPPFRSSSTRTSTAKESKASVSIPKCHTLSVVLRDSNWMEDVEAHARQTWGLNEDDSPAKSRAEWSASALELLYGSTRLHTMFKASDVEGCFQESSETDTDKRATLETPFMDLFFSLVGPASLSPASFSTTGQEWTKIDGGGTVRPHVAIAFISRETKRNLLHEEHKTSFVQFNLIHDLDKLVNTSRNYLSWSVAAEGIFTQAYAASYRQHGGLPASNIVQLGNASLWCMAYTMDRRLVLSKWYSINPQQAMDILAERGCPGILVHQGHLIRQKLALTSIDPAPFFATRVSYRSSPSTRGIILGAAAFLMSSTVDVFTRLGEILFLRPTGNLNLDGPRIHVRAISSTPAFRRALGKMSSFHTVQNGMVWTNDEWYLKIVTDLDEITATREVSEKAKVLEFGGELRVTTGEHTGKTLMATRTAGERIDADCLSEIEDSDVRCAIVTAIKAIHAAGWHHHDLQPRNVVVRDGQVTIIDFGSAQRASVCLEECCCPDRDAIGLLTISPSSSTETVVDLPPEMGEILAESVEDLEPKVKT